MEVLLRVYYPNEVSFARNLLDSEEVTKLLTALEHDEGVMKYNYGRDDGAGMRTKTVLWNQPGNDITGIIARSEKVAGTFEKVRLPSIRKSNDQHMIKSLLCSSWVEKSIIITQKSSWRKLTQVAPMSGIKIMGMWTILPEVQATSACWVTTLR